MWPLAEEFSDSTSLLKGLHTAKLDEERITILTIESLMRRRKSPATGGEIRNVVGLIQFSLNRETTLRPESRWPAIPLSFYYAITSNRSRGVVALLQAI